MDNNFLNKEDIAKMYNEMDEIWPDDDKWYNFTHNCVVKYIDSQKQLMNLTEKSLVLNLGSGGNEYNIDGIHYHVDIAEEKIRHCKNYFVSTAENIPFNNDFFDGGICVGSVINYCDPFAVISEISRTLKLGGYFIIDFEQSESWQFYGLKEYKNDATIITSFNSGYEDRIWIFSLDYIVRILKTYSLKIVNIKRFHLLSPLLYRITKDENKSAKFAKFDSFLKLVPCIRNKSCNIILTVQKV